MTIASSAPLFFGRRRSRGKSACLLYPGKVGKNWTARLASAGAGDDELIAIGRSTKGGGHSFSFLFLVDPQLTVYGKVHPYMGLDVDPAAHTKLTRIMQTTILPFLSFERGCTEADLLK